MNVISRRSMSGSGSSLAIVGVSGRAATAPSPPRRRRGRRKSVEAGIVDPDPPGIDPAADRDRQQGRYDTCSRCDGQRDRTRKTSEFPCPWRWCATRNVAMAVARNSSALIAWASSASCWRAGTTQSLE